MRRLVNVHIRDLPYLIYTSKCAHSHILQLSSSQCAHLHSILYPKWLYLNSLGLLVASVVSDTYGCAHPKCQCALSVNICFSNRCCDAFGLILQNVHIVSYLRMCTFDILLMAMYTSIQAMCTCMVSFENVHIRIPDHFYIIMSSWCSWHTRCFFRMCTLSHIYGCAHLVHNIWRCAHPLNQCAHKRIHLRSKMIR
jgi:hypothetical protein